MKFSYTNAAKGFEFKVEADSKKELFKKIEEKFGCPLEPSQKAMISRQLKKGE